MNAIEPLPAPKVDRFYTDFQFQMLEGMKRMMGLTYHEFVKEAQTAGLLAMPLPSAIGISGFAQSGKTTVANYIEERYGFERKHIAEPLRDMIVPLLRANGVAEDLIPRYLTGDLKEEVIPEIGVSSRSLQISLGTRWGREAVSRDLWAVTWQRGVKPGQKVMNDSVRFPNEEASIRDLHGFTIIVERPGTEPIAWRWKWFGRWLFKLTGLLWGAHDSERVDRLRPTYRVWNTGTLSHLFSQIDAIMVERGLA